MNVFISEYFTSGQCPNISPVSSLYQEGWAMLAAILLDAQAPNDSRQPLAIQCTTTLSGEISASTLPGINVIHVANPNDAQNEFRKQAAAADQTIVIAPESDGILSQQCQLVEDVGGQQIGCAASALELSSDKWKLFQLWNTLGISTPPTILLPASPNDIPFDFPLIIKPRHGAGGEQTWFIQNKRELNEISSQINNADGTQFIVQPYLEGEPCSIGILSLNEQDHLFPVCQQQIEWADSFHYRGGIVPITLTPTDEGQLHSLVAQTRKAIPGLYGYWGIDFIWNPNSSTHPISLIEINPRLTTSYLGYRQLTNTNLAQLWLQDSVHPITTCDPLHWFSKQICY